MRLDPGAEQDPAVYEHLKTCPKCRGLFNSVVNADIETVETAFTDFGGVNPDEKSRELESMICGFLFDHLYDAEKLKKIRAAAAGADENAHEYLNKFISFISETNATARERAAYLGFIGAASNEQKPAGLVPLSSVLKALIEKGYTIKTDMPVRYHSLRAAGDGDYDTSGYKEILPNKWVCSFTYRGGGQTTIIKLDFSMADTKVETMPVIEVMQLKGLNDGEVEEYCHPWVEVKHSRLENRQPVYEIDGRYSSLLSIPAAAAAFKVFTINDFKRGKK